MKTYKVTYEIKLYADVYVKAENEADAKAKLEEDGVRFESDNFGGTYNVDMETMENPPHNYDLDFSDDNPDWEISDVQEYDGERKNL